MFKKSLTVFALSALVMTTACQLLGNPMGSGGPGGDTSGLNPDSDASKGGSGKKITVGVFMKADDGSFSDSGKTITFDSEKECQTWTRTAQGDAINPEPHLHYNAAKNVSYKDDTFKWTEIGPAHSQEEIDKTCAEATSGADKTVNSKDYTQDKKFYLKIKKVE